MLKKTVILSTLIVLLTLGVSANLVITENGIDFSSAEDPYISGLLLSGIVGEQVLSVNSTPVNDNISISGGNSVQIEDNYEPNTDNQTLSDAVEEGGSLENEQNLDASQGTMQIPVGTDAY